MKWANDWKIKERGEKNIENCNHMACDQETVEGLEKEEGAFAKPSVTGFADGIATGCSLVG